MRSIADLVRPETAQPCDACIESGAESMPVRFDVKMGRGVELSLCEFHIDAACRIVSQRKIESRKTKESLVLAAIKSRREIQHPDGCECRLCDSMAVLCGKLAYELAQQQKGA